MIQLRPYQQSGIAETREAYRKHTRILYVAPTGSGKTVVFSHIASAAIARGKRVLILSDRVEIFNQNIRAIAKHDIPICKIDADNRRIDSSALLYVGMVESFKRRLPLFSHINFDLLIFDEAHKNSYNKIMDAYPNTHTLGCTATPTSKHQHKYYTSIVQSIDVPELIELGFLAPYKAFQMEEDISDLEKDKSGEYTERSQYAHYNKKRLYDGVIEKWREKCEGQRTLVFNCNIAHTEAMTRAFNEAGIRSFCVHSKTPDAEREWIMREFDRGAFAVLNNSNILVAGYDNPSVACVVLNRATTSLSAFLQMIGRGSRIFPGKSHFTVLDFGMNHAAHGLWCSPRTWSLEPPKKNKKLGAPPVKSCKQCGAMVLASVRVCEYCGFVWVPTERELAQGRLVEVTNQTRSAIEGRYVSQLTIPELIECEKAGAIKATYTWRLLRSRGMEAINVYAQMKGYRDAWIFRQQETLEIETAEGGRVQFKDKRINEVPRMAI